MSLLDYVLGRRLATYEEGEQRVGVVAGIPMLGLDALGSAAYGPEAALTLLIPLGTAGIWYIGPISTLIVALLIVVYFSYRQTIAAYPQGGGSYTVAKENLGTTAGLRGGGGSAARLRAGRRRWHLGGRRGTGVGAARAAAVHVAALPGDTAR